MEEGFSVDVPLPPDIPRGKPLGTSVAPRSIGAFHIDQGIEDISPIVAVGGARRERHTSVIASRVSEVILPLTKELTKYARIRIDLPTTIVLHTVAREGSMRAVGIADLSEAKGLDIMGAYMAVIVQSQTHEVALQARLILLKYPPMR